jgi:hypothetical protein
MPYIFRSKSGSDVLMLKAAGDEALRIVGHQPERPGIVQCCDLPQAIGALEHAVQAQEVQMQEVQMKKVQEAWVQAQKTLPDRNALGQDPLDNTTCTEEISTAVLLRQRYWPLLALMRTAQCEGNDVLILPPKN